MGEIAINPKHNVFKKYRQVNYINSFVFTPVVTWNTYIGGVSSTISTASLLAAKLGISVGAISNFEVVGSDIKCKITGSYALTGIFDANITSFNDVDGLCTSIPNGAFYNTQLVNLWMKNCTSIQSSCFDQNVYGFQTLKILYIPNCTSFGTTVGNNNLFRSNFSTCNIYAHPSMATINAGGVEGDLASMVNATISYVTNFTAPNPVTDLAAGTIYNTAIQLNFTPPSSANTIYYYECYANGVFKNKITANGQYITGLDSSSFNNITIIAVDVFLNKSGLSNTLTQTTSTPSYTDADANAYISVASLTGVEQESAYALIVELKAQSLYTKCQAIYPFKGTTAAQHKFNAKNPVDTDAAFRLVFSGTGTYSNLGFQTNGSNAYADTKFVPSTNQKVNSNGITVVSGTNNSASTRLPIECGNYQSGTQSSLVAIKWEDTNEKRIRMNGNALTTMSYSQNNGALTATRQSSTVTKGFLNGTQILNGNSGGTLPSISLFIGAGNIFGSAAQFSNQRIQMVIFHEGLNDVETTTLHSIIDLSETIAGRKTW